MFKQLLNEAVLELALLPDGPVLIKAGEMGGADQTHPDMEFVRTVGRVFIPGASLKGVVRAHAEKIARTLQPQIGPGRGACNPLDHRASCGGRLEREQRSDHRYAGSCFACRLFGSTAVAGRARFTDALPAGEVTLEERNGVAIDRVYGSVAIGPFNYEVVTQGAFGARITMRNFTLAQLALVGLALRDLGEGRVGLGFGKSRGMGRVTLKWSRIEVRYPLGTLRRPAPADDTLLGVGELFRPEPEINYGFPRDDRAPLPGGLRFADDGWGTLRAAAEGDEQVQAVFKVATARWREEVGRG